MARDEEVTRADHLAHFCGDTMPPFPTRLPLYSLPEDQTFNIIFHNLDFPKFEIDYLGKLSRDNLLNYLSVLNR
jgi:hypothetical protein